MEHPAITNAIRTGYPNGTPKCPHCPECGAECDTIYRDKYGEIFGCSECVQTDDAWETEECF